MINEELIKNWGIPEFIKDRNIEFIFNTDDLNSNLKNNEIIQNLLCDSIGAKFCLYDKENNKIILTMDFIIFRISENPLFIEREKCIKLNCLCVNDFEMRDKGIAKYYLEKLIEFGISNDINKFKLIPNPEDELFENLDKRNNLSPEDLKNWYIRKFKKFGFSPNNLSGENDKLSQIIFEK